jgi:glycosyltransferase involved in cell wall biosynthesis
MIYAVMPVYNEVDRYLQSVLTHLLPLVDSAFVYDDQSTDDSFDMAADMGAEVRTSISGFLEHEGKFRQEMWWEFERVMSPREGDWVLAIDADEYLTTQNADCTSASQLAIELMMTIKAAEAAGHISVRLPVPEAFALENGVASVRIDGLWATVAGPRLFQYRPNGSFRQVPMGCGSEPSYVSAAGPGYMAHDMELLHVGYAHPDDVAAKYKRYTSLEAHGHNDAHIESIISQPVLHEYLGMPPYIYRGAR